MSITEMKDAVKTLEILVRAIHYKRFFNLRKRLWYRARAKPMPCRAVRPHFLVMRRKVRP